MLRTILLASRLAFGAGIAEAAPRLVGGGDDSHVEYDGIPGGSLVGRGQEMLAGGGADRSYGYADLRAQTDRVAVLVGGGDEARLLYLPAVTAGGLAWGAAARFGG